MQISWNHDLTIKNKEAQNEILQCLTYTMIDDRNFLLFTFLYIRSLSLPCLCLSAWASGGNGGIFPSLDFRNSLLNVLILVFILVSLAFILRGTISSDL